MRRLAVALLCALGVCAVSFAAENFPPPEFSRPYVFPETTTPGARSEWLGLVDAAVLLLSLGLAAYLALRTRSRQHLVALTLFAVGYFGFYRRGCICAVGAIQNVALAISDSTYVLPAVAAAFFLLPLLFALFFGRVFCAAVCPLGAVQELVLLRPVRVPAWLDQGLGLLPYLYLGFGALFSAIGSAFIVCQYDPFIAFYRLGGNAVMLAVGAGILLLSVVVGRPYCRYACPYGVLLRWLAPLARWRPRITPTACVNCHLCADACPYGAIRPPTVGVEGGSRQEGRGRLMALVALLPLLIVAGAGLMRLASPAVSRVDRTVRLADRVWLEEQGAVMEQTPQSEAFSTLGLDRDELYQRATEIRDTYDRGAWVLGAWVGGVIGLRLIGLSVRRRRPEYDADPAACVACGRCYAACPVHQAGGAVDFQAIAGKTR